MKLKIAFFGSSLVSSYWNGAATYYRGLIKELHKKGHNITFYEPDAFERQQHRDIENPEYAKVVVYQANEADADKCFKEASNADLVIKASGVGVLDEYLEKRVVDMKLNGQLTAFWDVDAPATLYRVNTDLQDPFRSLIPEYDYIFTYGGGQPVIDKYKALGAKDCFPIYNALDPSTHHPVGHKPAFESDLAFLGNRLPDREQRVEEYFIKAASLLPDRKFLLGGNGWQDKFFPENVKQLGHVSTNDHNAFNSTPIAVLNICRDSMATNGFSPATRVFEAAGAKACIITDEWEGIETFLEPGIEILVAKNGSDVAEIVSCLKPDVAKAIGESGYERVMSEHTYAHRATQFEEILNVNQSILR